MNIGNIFSNWDMASGQFLVKCVHHSVSSSLSVAQAKLPFFVGDLARERVSKDGFCGVLCDETRSPRRDDDAPLYCQRGLAHDEGPVAAAAACARAGHVEQVRGGRLAVRRRLGRFVLPSHSLGVCSSYDTSPSCFTHAAPPAVQCGTTSTQRQRQQLL